MKEFIEGAIGGVMLGWYAAIWTFKVLMRKRLRDLRIQKQRGVK